MAETFGTLSQIDLIDFGEHQYYYDYSSVTTIVTYPAELQFVRTAYHYSLLL